MKASQRLLVALGLSAAALTLPTSADAQGGIPPLPTEPAPDYYEVAQDTWEVRGLQPTVNELTADSPVWDMVEINGVMYVGGQFTAVREGPSAPETAQPFLAAFDATTGVWIDSFRPVIDGPVFALARTRAGKLLVGGEFTMVNGTANTRGLAALEPTTGALVAGWRATVSNSGPPMAVMDIFVRRNDVYIAGNMNRVRRPGSKAVRVNQVARLDAATGAVDRSFRPRIRGGRVNVVTTSPKGNKVYLGGYFSSANRAPALHFATLRSDGRLAPVPQGLEKTPSDDAPAAIFDIVATRRRVYLAGEFHHLHILDARTGRRAYSYVSAGFGGDYQATTLAGGVLWLGGHFHGIEVPLVVDDTTPDGFKKFLTEVLRLPGQEQVQWVTPHDPVTGHRLDGFVPRLEMSDGVWDIEVSSSGMLWVGGDARRSQGGSLGGFAVFRMRQAGDEVNLAEGRRASQSSTAECCGADVRRGEASRAVDAKTAGNFHERSSSLTERTREPWWQVDLGGRRQIDELRIWPMTATGALGFTEPVVPPAMRVFVSNRRFGNRDTIAEVAAMAGVQSHTITSFPDAGFVELPVDRRGRYVRVFAVGRAQLGLGEVEVIEGDPALIATTATWQWSTAEPTVGWETAAYDHTTWATGAAPLGKGEADVATDVGDVETFYSYRTFTATDVTGATFELDVVRDDGAAIYVNGVEVARLNLPDGPLGHTTTAVDAISGADETVAVTVAVPAGVIVEGVNTIAAQLHNVSSTSEDLRFSLRLRRVS